MTKDIATFSDLSSGTAQNLTVRRGFNTVEWKSPSVLVICDVPGGNLTGTARLSSHPWAQSAVSANALHVVYYGVALSPDISTLWFNSGTFKSLRAKANKTTANKKWAFVSLFFTFLHLLQRQSSIDLCRSAPFGRRDTLRCTLISSLLQERLEAIIVRKGSNWYSRTC